MKKFFVIIFLFSTLKGVSQEIKKHDFYEGASFSLGNYYGYHIGLNYTYNEVYNYEFRVSYNFRKPKEQPNDYELQLVEKLLFLILAPRDDVFSYNILFGKIYPMKRERFFFNLKGGFAYSYISKRVNYIRINNNGKYTSDVVRSNAIGLVINPEFILGNWHLSPYILTSKNETIVAVKINYHFKIQNWILSLFN